LDGPPVHIFRFGGDRIAELKDLDQAVPEDSPSENGMFEKPPAQFTASLGELPATIDFRVQGNALHPHNAEGTRLALR
jgi:hypothetical protein